jgi:hypothetical protein
MNPIPLDKSCLTDPPDSCQAAVFKGFKSGLLKAVIEILGAPFGKDECLDLGKNYEFSVAREFQETHAMKVKDEIERLSRELGKLDEQWVFVAP